MRVLFLGCGNAARAHSRVLRKIGGARLYYASRDPHRAEAFREEFDGWGAFDSYEDALTRNADIVVVTTPTGSHHDLALAALAAGKHVVVEKPAFLDSLEAQCVQGAATQAGLKVFVAENYAYKPITLELRRLITNGDLGEVRFVSINATKRQRVDGWRADPAMSGGGAMFEGGVHWVSFASNIGLEVASAEGFPTSNAWSALMVLRYTNGAVGTLAYSWELAAPMRGLRMSTVQGTEGAVTFESNGLAMLTSGRARSVRIPAFRDLLGARAMWSDFLLALRTGGEPRFTLAMAARDLRSLEEAGFSFEAARESPAPRSDSPVTQLAR